MKKLSKPLSARFGEVLLFRDDFERIVLILGELGPVQIRASDFLFDSFDELVSSGEDYLNAAYINCKDPFAYVDIEDKNVRIFLGADESQQRQAFDRIAGIVRSRVIVRDSILESPTIIGALCGACLSMMMAVQFLSEIPYKEKNAMTFSAIMVLIALLIWDRVTLRRYRNQRSQIWLKKLTPGEILWKRNSERITAAIIALVIVVIVLVILQFS